MRFLFPGRIGIWKCCFFGGRKTGEPGEKLPDQGKNQQQTQPTYDARCPFLEGPEKSFKPLQNLEPYDYRAALFTYY